MAKVSSVKLKIRGEIKEYGIYYTKSEKFYIKDFPVEVKGLMASVEIVNRNMAGHKFETENELLEHYNALIDRYHKVITQTRKVIAYHLSAPDEFKCLPEVSEEIKEKLGYEGDFAFRQSIIIDYTPEREIFLKNMQTRMKDMFLKVMSAMMDEEKFVEIMDKNIKLLA